MVRAGVHFAILAWHWYSGHIDAIEEQGERYLLGELLRFEKLIWITELNFQLGLLASKQGNSNGQSGLSNGCICLLATMKHMNQLHNRGVKAYFIYELLDEPHSLRRDPQTVEAHYGLAKFVLGSDDQGWRVGRRKRAFHVVG